MQARRGNGAAAERVGGLGAVAPEGICIDCGSPTMPRTNWPAVLGAYYAGRTAIPSNYHHRCNTCFAPTQEARQRGADAWAGIAALEHERAVRYLAAAGRFQVHKARLSRACWLRGAELGPGANYREVNARLGRVSLCMAC